MRFYFYGIKVQVSVNKCTISVEFGFVPRCENDEQALFLRKIMQLSLKGFC